MLENQYGLSCIDAEYFAGRQLVVEAKLARSSLQPVPGEQDDLPDPMGRGIAEFEVCADRLQDAIDRILRPLGTVAPS